MIYVFLADGFEDMEAITAIDMLKRAKFEVKTVGVTSKSVKSVAGIVMQTDITAQEAQTKDLKAIVLPGGMPGAANLYECKKVRDIISFCVENNILIGAICAAPMILGDMGLLKGKHVCAFPGTEEHLKGAVISSDYVCKDGNIITAKGPGAATGFSCALIEYLRDKRAVGIIKRSMQFPEA
jgi:protein deglycase